MKANTSDLLKFVMEHVICAVERHDNLTTTTKVRQGRKGFTTTQVKLLTTNGEVGIFPWTPEAAECIDVELFHHSILSLNSNGYTFLREHPVT
jgi:hypothetical protein